MDGLRSRTLELTGHKYLEQVETGLHLHHHPESRKHHWHGSGAGQGVSVITVLTPMLCSSVEIVMFWDIGAIVGVTRCLYE